MGLFTSSGSAMQTHTARKVMSLAVFLLLTLALHRAAHVDDHPQLQLQRRQRSLVVMPFNETELTCGDILGEPNVCELQHDYCEVESIFDYYTFLFCSIPQAQWAGLTLMIAFMAYLFICLGISAEGYFCTALSFISDTLGLSENVAGVTFLALGNGAPDLFSSFSAVSQGSASLSLGALLGAGIFVNTVVVGSIALITPFKMTRRPFARDVAFYMVGVLAVWGFVVNGVVEIWASLLLVFWYVTYVTVVIVGRQINQRWKKMKKEAEAEEDKPLLTEKPQYGYQGPNGGPVNINGTEDDLSAPLHSVAVSPRPMPGRLKRTQSDLGSISGAPSLSQSLSLTISSMGEDLSSPNSGHNSPKRKHKRTKSLEGQFQYSSQTASLLVGSSASQINADGDDDVFAPAKPQEKIMRHSFHGIEQQPEYMMIDAAILTPALKARIAEGFALGGGTDNPFSHFKKADNEYKPPAQRFVGKLFPFYEEWPTAGPFKKFYLILGIPLHLVLAVTVPLVEHIESEDIRRTESFSWWSRHVLALNLFVDPLFITWSMGFLGGNWGGFPVWGFCLILGMVISLLCLLVTEDERPPRFYQVLAPLSFLTSVLWIYFFAGELVAVIGVLGIVIGVSETLLGLTVLAWGNSIGDLISNTTMARLGFANMGVSACFGSPLLNLLLGFGLSCTTEILRSGFDIPVEASVTLHVSFGTLLVVMLSHAVVIPTNKFQGPRWYGYYLLGIFLTYTTFNIVTELTGVFN